MIHCARRLLTSYTLPRLEPMAHFERMEATGLCAIVGSAFERTFIEEEVERVAQTDQGVQLMTRLHISVVASGKPMTIGVGDQSSYESMTNHITLSPQSGDCYYLGHQDGGQIAVGKHMPDHTLHHEAIHAIHHMEEPKKFMQRGAVELIGFTNLEEQLTITGRASAAVDPLNENALLKETGRTPRSSHLVLSQKEVLATLNGCLRTATLNHSTPLALLRSALAVQAVYKQHTDELLMSASLARSDLLLDSVRATLFEHDFSIVE